MSKAMQLKAKIKNMALANHIPAQAVLWDRYCKENYYANGIAFDDVIGALLDLVK